MPTQLTLDHFLIKLSKVEDKQYNTIKKQLDEIGKESRDSGFPFTPFNGRGTDWYQSSSLWIGSQYLSMWQIMEKPKSSVHAKDIVSMISKTSEEEKGCQIIYLACTNIEELYEKLYKNDLCEKDAIRREVNFSYLFNWVTVESPWRVLFLNAPIPGTNIRLAFIQYDANSFESFEKYMQPNSNTNRIFGIKSCEVTVPGTTLTDLTSYLKKIFSTVAVAKKQVSVQLSYGQELVFEADQNITEPLIFCASFCDSDIFIGKSVTVENVTLENVSMTDKEIENVNTMLRERRLRSSSQDQQSNQVYMNYLFAIIAVLVAVYYYFLRDTRE